MSSRFRGMRCLLWRKTPMQGNRTVTLTVCNRPDYLARVLQSLACVRGIEDWCLFIGLEPDNEQCAALCERIDFMPKTILRNPTVLGVRENPFRLLSHVFEAGSTLNIYLEDDTVVSPDITELAVWYEGALDGDCLGEYRCAFLGLFTTNLSMEGADELLLTRTFLPWGLVFNSYQWRTHVQPFWWRDKHRFGPRRDWTLGLSDHLMDDPKLTLLVPRVSRVRNIGRDGGVHPNPAGHDLYCRVLVMNESPGPFNYWVNPNRQVYWRTVNL